MLCDATVCHHVCVTKHYLLELQAAIILKLNDNSSPQIQLGLTTVRVCKLYLLTYTVAL